MLLPPISFFILIKTQNLFIYLSSLIIYSLFLGRAALPKSLTPNSGGRLSVLRRLDSSGERTHRQLIDCIRSKDTGKSINIYIYRCNLTNFLMS